MFYLRKEIIDIFKNANKKELKLLLKVKSDVKFIFSNCFLQVYPLLFHLASLIYYIQNENLSWE